MPRPLHLLLCWLLLFTAAQAGAQSRMVFDGCVDARGAAVRSVPDPALAVAFTTRVEHGANVIRYNATVPPGLSERARLFFYAHECARLGLGLAADALRTVGDAWRADCRALDTLTRSGLVRPQDLAVLQADLALPDAMWDALPGPQREIDLAACARAAPSRGLALPPRGAAEQSRWNACVHACGDVLLQCQRRTCGGLDCPACLPANDACVAACDASR